MEKGGEGGVEGREVFDVTSNVQISDMALIGISENEGL
jgi:hypothetical protein